MLGNARGRIPVVGSSFSLTSHRLTPSTVALCISQSGQTFPTIHVTRILNLLLPGRVFIMCGSVDTKMALALGQKLDAASPFTERIFMTHAGWRSTEPPSVVVVAIHHTCTELLLQLTVQMKMRYASSQPLGLTLEDEDVMDLRLMADRFVDGAQLVVGIEASTGRRLGSEEAPAHAELVAAGHKWAQHILEPALAW